MKKELKASTEFTVPYDWFEAVIVGALEGGSNYWYLLDITPKLRAQLMGENGQPLSSRIALTLYENPDFALPVYDLETADPSYGDFYDSAHDTGEPELLGHVTQASMLKAFSAEQLSDHVQDLREGCDDANTADCLFQWAVMGDVIFG